MAPSNRQDRALMRQRGAGMRTVENVDFGLNNAFGNERLERQQMRQRGAASRKIDNIDFGISFPSSARSLRSTAATPQSRASVTRPQTKTPIARSREPSVARSTRRNSHAPQTPSEQSRASFEQADVQTRSTKRRKLSSSTTTPAQPSGRILRPLSNTRSSRRNARNVFSIVEDENADEGSTELDNGKPSVQQAPPTSPLFVPEGTGEENDISGNVGSEDSLAIAELQVEQNPTQQDMESLSAQEITAAEGEAPEGSIEDSQGTSEELGAPQSATTSAIPKTKKQKKRKSVVINPRKRRASGRRVSVENSREGSLPAIESRAASEEPSTSTLPPLANRISQYSKLGKIRKRHTEAVLPRGERTFEEEAEAEAEDEEDQSYIQESSPEPETPAPPKKSAKQALDRPVQDEAKDTSKKRKRNHPTFPILTHRATNVSTLPTIREGGEEDEAESAIGREDSNHIVPVDRAQPNAADVLAQICRETISNLVEQMSQNVRPSARAASNNKRSAMEAFGRDLDDELFAMSEAVENRINLEARVRKSKREKSALQTEWAELRKEREQIALKCDAVRRRNWECEQDAREKWTLSEAARRAEQHVEIPQVGDEPDDGLEFLLATVAGLVSSASAQAGVLDRVKSFNARLESMAMELER